jgi:APA family basic amino acid/polyamine antiporter
MSVTSEIAGSDAPELRRALGPWHLITLGIGAIIGAGIFVSTGQAAAQFAGPGVVISFAIAGVGCFLAGLCYAEFSSMIPVAGSAYSYAYATLGQFFAWIIGWDLILEYLAAGSAVAVGWSGYFNALMAEFGVQMPTAFTTSPITIDAAHNVGFSGAIINLPAAILILAITVLLVVGIRASATFNAVMVVLKLAVVVLVIAFGLFYVRAENLTPFIPANTGTFGQFGWSGILRASGVIFFAYIGFDAVSVAAQEAVNPQRNMPIGILGSLLICTVLYMLMSFVITGLAPYQSLNVPNPVSVAVTGAGPGLGWLRPLVNIGATIGLGTVVLVLLLGQTRIFYAMSRDGMLPPFFSRVHPRFRTPYLGTIVTGTCATLLSAFLPHDLLIELVSIGTLAAFVIVCIGIIVLRYTAPKAHRPFRTPFVPWVPLGGVAVCGAMMMGLPLATWIRLVVWLFVGLVVYATYAARRARPPKWVIANSPAE